MKKQKNKNEVCLVNNKSECCGCSACYSICPNKAITMQQDDEGFLYPKIDFDKCIGCKKCINVCAFKNRIKKYSINRPEFYAVKIKNDNERVKSQSGGLFVALSNSILKRKGRVYGCIIDENFEAIHIGTDNAKIRDKMRKSKYVQSRINESYKIVKEDLEANKEVLFSGTPCQIDGLKNYLGKDYNNLYLVDIICHGVPSPMVWKNYLKWQESKNEGKCKKVIFRNTEKFGWRSHIETFELKVNNEMKTIDSTLYTNLFYSHLIVRPSCFSCPYKNINRSSDITIGDYWGIEKIDKDFEDTKGVSIAIINSGKGKRLFEEIKPEIVFKKTTVENSLQEPLVKPYKQPRNRDKFWKDYKSKSLNKIINKYAKHGIKWKTINFLRKIKHRLVIVLKLSK